MVPDVASACGCEHVNTPGSPEPSCSGQMTFIFQAGLSSEEVRICSRLCRNSEEKPLKDKLAQQEQSCSSRLRRRRRSSGGH